MATLDFQIGMMPLHLQRIAAVVGAALAVKLARRFGGRNFYVPEKIYGAHPLAECLGLRAATMLCAEFAREEFELPSARPYLNWLDARALRVCGLSPAMIAGRLGIGLRQVQKLLVGFDPAAIELSDTVHAVAKYYGVRLARGRGAGAAPVVRAQADFGFAPDRRGMRFTRR